MSQITNGVRSILSIPLVYQAFQLLMGAHKGRQKFVANFVKPFSGMSILDLGCGPADILQYLPEVNYWGFDMSEDYINLAKSRFGDRGHFDSKLLEMTDLEGLPSFDVVFALGVLHHLDDKVAESVMQLAFSALKPGGRFLTFDPCFDEDQNFISRFLVGKDRGQNVRSRIGYESLSSQFFTKTNVVVHHDDLRIPYTICYMECIK